MPQNILYFSSLSWIVKLKYISSNIALFVTQCVQIFWSPWIYILMSCYLDRFLFLSLHSSLPYITSDRSSRLYPVSVKSCCRWVLVGHSKLARPSEEVHRRTSLMSSFLLYQQYPACLVRLIWMVLKIRIGGRKAGTCGILLSGFVLYDS